MKDTYNNFKFDFPTNIPQLCDLYNVPIATNLATAELMIKTIDKGFMDWD